MRDPNSFFTAQDIDDTETLPRILRQDIAKHLNALIRDALGPKVFENTSRDYGWLQISVPLQGDTHEAHLFCIKEINSRRGTTICEYSVPTDDTTLAPL
jgi:hypothetical protein